MGPPKLELYISVIWRDAFACYLNLAVIVTVCRLCNESLQPACLPVPYRTTRACQGGTTFGFGARCTRACPAYCPAIQFEERRRRGSTDRARGPVRTRVAPSAQRSRLPSGSRGGHRRQPPAGHLGAGWKCAPRSARLADRCLAIGIARRTSDTRGRHAVAQDREPRSEESTGTVLPRTSAVLVRSFGPCAGVSRPPSGRWNGPRTLQLGRDSLERRGVGVPGGDSRVSDWGF